MPKYIDTIGNLLIEDCKNWSCYNPEFINSRRNYKVLS